jgi:formate hydrogenlyase subunit 4
MNLLHFKVIAGVALLIFASLLSLVFEGVDRIIHARMQLRLGPPLFQPFFDILKLLGKENIVPRRAIPWAFNGAPWVSAAAALMILLYVPMGSLPPILAGSGDLILILYLLGLSAVAMAVGGFASGSTYANVGAQREMTLMMSYELPLAVVIITLAWFSYRSGMPGEPFSLETFVGMPVWSVVGWTGLFGLICLLIALLAVVPAEVGKVPMDIAEAKTEILEGLICEYSGRNLAMMKIAFSLRTLVMCAVVVSLFFPWTIGKHFGLQGAMLFLADFVFFWVKVFLMQIAGVTLVRTAFGRYKIWQASQFYWFHIAGLSLAGMVLLSLDVIL